MSNRTAACILEKAAHHNNEGIHLLRAGAGKAATKHFRHALEKINQELMVEPPATGGSLPVEEDASLSDTCFNAVVDCPLLSTQGFYLQSGYPISSGKLT